MPGYLENVLIKRYWEKLNTIMPMAVTIKTSKKSFGAPREDILADGSFRALCE